MILSGSVAARSSSVRAFEIFTTQSVRFERFLFGACGVSKPRVEFVVTYRTADALGSFVFSIPELGGRPYEERTEPERFAGFANEALDEIKRGLDQSRFRARDCRLRSPHAPRKLGLAQFGLASRLSKLDSYLRRLHGTSISYSPYL